MPGLWTLDRAGTMTDWGVFDDQGSRVILGSLTSLLGQAKGLYLPPLRLMINRLVSHLI